MNRGTVLLGKISFSLYLVHFYVGREVGRVMAGSTFLSSHVLRIACVFAAIGLLSSGASLVTWRLIEEPCIRLGRRLISHTEERNVPPTLAEEQF